MNKLQLYLEGCEDRRDQLCDREKGINNGKMVPDFPLPLHGRSVQFQCQIVVSMLLQMENIHLALVEAYFKKKTIVPCYVLTLLNQQLLLLGFNELQWDLNTMQF